MANLSPIENLLVKRLLNEITPEETQKLEALSHESIDNWLLIERMRPDKFHRRRRALGKIDYYKLDKLLKQKTGMPGIFEEDPTTRKARALHFVRIAAIICLALAIIWGYWYKYHG